MSAIVIVAIPEEDDPVWKVSSEKIPHMTLLYMEGPLENEENTIQFVEHVVKTSMCRFGMSVDRRGTLGPDDADVLFFDKTYGGKELIASRGFFLTNKDILTAYRKAEQYPVWTPHLTLGYPETPAHPNPNNYAIHWVNFDRVAIWTEDYAGPEFVLPKNSDMELDVPGSWSEGDFGEYLEHFGVKGMRWGVRHDPNTHTVAVSEHHPGYKVGDTFFDVTGKQSTIVSVKKASPEKHAEVKSRVGLSSGEKVLEIKTKKSDPISNRQKVKEWWNRIPPRTTRSVIKATFKEVDKIEAEDWAKNPTNLLDSKGKPDSRKIAAYDRRYEKITNEVFTRRLNEAQALRSKFGPYAQSTVDRQRLDLAIRVGLVSTGFAFHSDDNELFEFHIPIKIKDDGRIEVMDDELQQNEDISDLDDVLMHFGVRGMRWGVRRSLDSSGHVEGTVAGAIKSGQHPSAHTTQPSLTKGKKVKLSDDHKQMVKNLDKKVEHLSTAEIKQITARIKAVNDLKKETEAQKAAKAKLRTKLTKWALNQVVEGAKTAGESWIKEQTGDILKDFLPKTKAAKEKIAKDEAAKAKEAAKEQKDAADKARTAPQTRDEALNSLVYEITSLPKKGG